MTIVAIIIEPKDSNFNIPVSTEAFFKRCWVPGIKELQLELVSYFDDPGIDLTKKYLPKLLDELKLLKEWAKGNLAENDSNHLISRIDNLEEELIKAFRDEVIIYIG